MYMYTTCYVHVHVYIHTRLRWLLLVPVVTSCCVVFAGEQREAGQDAGAADGVVSDAEQGGRVGVCA